MISEIRLPAAWNQAQTFDLLQLEAGRHYILDQMDSSSTAIQPEHVFNSDNPRSDTASYSVYSDGSLWFKNNAEDEIWADFRDAVSEHLIRGIEAQQITHWTQDEVDASDDQAARCPDNMDRQLLLLSCDGDEDAARESIGLAPINS